jgi:hypothetical protein
MKMGFNPTGVPMEHVKLNRRIEKSQGMPHFACPALNSCVIFVLTVNYRLFSFKLLFDLTSCIEFLSKRVV